MDEYPQLKSNGRMSVEAVWGFILLDNSKSLSEVGRISYRNVEAVGVTISVASKE